MGCRQSSVQREMTALKVYIKKDEKISDQHLTFYLKKLEEKQI